MSDGSTMARRIGPYPLVAPVHEGTFTAVYRCRDIAVGRDVAVKAVNQHTPHPARARQQLRREATVRALLDHPHVLPLYRVVRTRAGPILVAPWLTGTTLIDRIRAVGPLSPPEALALADGLGAALDAVHAAGWWHGDVSADNVLLTTPSAMVNEGAVPRDAAACRAVLADFGTARPLGEGAGAGGGLVVTPHVTAPEVWTGEPVDGRSDLYGLGVLLYLSLTGAHPFHADDVEAFAELHACAGVPRPTERSALVGPATEAVLLQALAKAPAARFPRGADLAAALNTALRRDGLLDGPSARLGIASAPTAGAASRVPTSLPFDERAVQAAGEQLDRFAATLGEAERTALRVLLGRVPMNDAQALSETASRAAQVLAPAAALLALEESGAAAFLAGGPRTAAETASACAAPERTLGQVLDYLAALGLLDKRDERFALPASLATVYRRRGRGAAGPIKDAAEFWSHLPRWAAKGEPLIEVDQPDGSEYARVTGLQAAFYKDAAHEVAAALRAGGHVPAGAQVLDVGAGSAVWGLAVVAPDPDATITALDRPRVLEVTRLQAESAGLADRLRTVAGDWRHVELPRSHFDVVLLANICHLESGKEVERLLGRVFVALRPGGTAVIVDVMPDEGADTDLAALLKGLHLGMRTPEGGVHDRASLTTWLIEAGLTPTHVVPVRSMGGRLTALLARRLPAQPVPGPTLLDSVDRSA